MKLVEYVGCRCQDLSSLVRIARIFCIRSNEGWHPNFLVAGPVSPTPRVRHTQLAQYCQSGIRRQQILSYLSFMDGDSMFLFGI